MKIKNILIIFAMSILGLTSCNSDSCKDNPFFSDYGTYLEAPAFDKIKNEHYMPAFIEGMKQNKAEIEAICNNSETPTFENTIWAYDKSGELLGKVGGVFFNMMECMSDDELLQIAEEVMPMMSAHGDDIAMNPVLFEKIKYVYDHRAEMNLDDQQNRVVEKYYNDFIRRGANLNEEDQAKLREINERLSILSLQFGNNLLKENSNFKLVIDNEKDLAGLPQSSIDAAAEQAKKDGMEGKWAFTLSKPSLIPFLTYSDNSMLRDEIYNAYYNRCDNNNEYDNKAIIKEMLALRLQKAQLFGFDNYANYVLDVNMAKDDKTVDKFLDGIFNSANELAKKELCEMQELAPAKIQRSDWWYYAEQLRKAKYDFDENQIRPYLSLDNVRNGMFMAANKLYGVTFEKRNDIPIYFEGVETYEVKDFDGSTLGLLYLDFYPRESKSSGAWCTSFREGGYDINGVWHPALIQLVMNFTPASGDAPALLDWDETETMWHEFGHSLHSFFSKGRYSRTCGNVPHDYVELPSQIMENWAGEPEVIRMYAKHYKTGEVMPDSLIEKLENSALFNQGFNTTELIAASILDMKYHELTDINVINNLDVDEFERQQMNAIGLIREIQPRYRSTNFSHVFSGGYSAGYYAYTWAEVLDKDAFNFFKESGDLFNPELAKSFRINCLQECGNDEGMVQYKKFRGQEPRIEPYLKARGLK
ncbi:MAG: peptidase M3 [Bacteroidetes bacterium]|nr:peptidase M3 [Bacteroidota bacterium]